MAKDAHSIANDLRRKAAWLTQVASELDPARGPVRPEPDRDLPTDVLAALNLLPGAAGSPLDVRSRLQRPGRPPNPSTIRSILREHAARGLVVDQGGDLFHAKQPTGTVEPVERFDDPAPVATEEGWDF